MIVIGKLLGRLDRYYHKVTRTERDVRVQVPWMKSMRGERESGRPFRMLNLVMVVSVGLAGICFGIWFFVFAGSSLPQLSPFSTPLAASSPARVRCTPRRLRPCEERRAMGSTTRCRRGGRGRRACRRARP